MCRTAKLQYADMEMMTVGMALDYIDAYQDLHHPSDKENQSRKATQADIEKLKGR
ncbi:MAG TPA: hypothetical protein H9983_07125 [Candidatus Kurthia intestinigallinarum]|nr:hypothetical protein [Candidatus Kurthia intestinigallinarum]